MPARRPPVPATRRFELRSQYQPAGDQPQAIAALIEGLERGEREQVLLGVTGSGKTFTIANVIADVQRPTLVLAPNKILAAQLYAEMKGFFPEERGRVLRQLLRLLPAGSLRPAHRHLHRQELVDQRADRPDAPLGDPRAARAQRRDHRRLGLLHLRHRRRRDLRADGAEPGRGPAGRAQGAAAAGWSSCSTSATTWPSPAASSGRRATSSRSFPRIWRTGPGGCRCSATRSRRSGRSIR